MYLLIARRSVSEQEAVKIIEQEHLLHEEERKCCTMEDVLKAVDVVIVTVISDNKKVINDKLKEKLNAEILWIEDMIFDMSKKI